MKLLITLLLVTAILSITPIKHEVRAQPKLIEYIVVGAIALGVGVVIVVGLKSMASKIPALTPPPAPPTNPPPVMNPTNAPASTNGTKPWYKRIFGSKAPSMIDISAYQVHDTFSTYKALVNYDTMIGFKIESSTNLVEWRTELMVTGWISGNGKFLACWRDGVNVTNTYTYGVADVTNYVPLDIGSGDEPMKVFRVGE